MRVEYRDSPEAYFWERTMLVIVIQALANRIGLM